MKNSQLKGVKRLLASTIGDIIEDISDLIVQIPCRGDWYEPKVPEKLKKE